MGDLHVLQSRLQRDNMSVIERVEEALEQAKAGEIRSIALAVVRPDFALNTAWSDCNDATGPLIAATVLLQKRLVEKFDE